MSEKAILNVESLLAVSTILLLLLRSLPTASKPLETVSRWQIPAFGAALAGLLFLLFWGNSHDPFLFDDYLVLHNAAIATLRGVVAEFGHVPWRGVFYRPIASLTFWVNYKWAGRDPLAWHLYSIALHAVNSLLVFTLLRLLNIARNAAIAGALFFGVFAGCAEAVVWLSAEYDLTCTLLILLALIAMLMYSKSPHGAALGAALLLCALACGVKESAFCIPLLGAALAIPLTGARRRSLLKASLATLLVCLAIFPYRWWAINGIGGYTAGESPTFLRFNLLHAANGMFFRAWGVLFFPINWSGHSIDKPEAIALAAYLILLVLAVCTIRAQRALLLCAVAFAGAALLPVYQMTLISSDLAGARVLYVPTIGLAILVASVFGATGWKRALPAAIALAFFHVMFLQHNLQFWRATAERVPPVCRDMAAAVSRAHTSVLVTNLPTRRDGVPFLANGFPECVAFYTPGAPDTLPAMEAGEKPGFNGPVFVWDPSQNRLRPR